MIHIPVLRSKRITARLKELSILDAIGLAAIPEHLSEEATTTFLRAALAEASGVADPEQWTVQERILAVCHYMAATLDDGPDFALAGGAARYSDYLLGDRQYGVPEIDVGELEGDQWTVRHLTGARAASIERLQGEIAGIDGRTHWQIGAMAAQMVPNGDGGPETGDGEIDAFLLARMRVIAGFPESVFAQLLFRYREACAKLEHLFRVDFDDAGLIVLPREDAAGTKPAARFPAGACVTPLARRLVGKPAAAG